jgi:hypothetical protein
VFNLYSLNFNIGTLFKVQMVLHVSLLSIQCFTGNIYDFAWLLSIHLLPSYM